MVAVICLRSESEILLDSLLDDLKGISVYPVDSDQVIRNLLHMRRTRLVEVDWRKGIIKRQPSMKGYVDKLVKGELWPKMLDDWRRIGSLIQTKYNKINPEYQELVA
jgi:hypothetical protein